jgi:D-inositol-3-phosphate glycosyltransferase
LKVLYSFPDTLGKPGIGTTAFHQIEGLVDDGAEVTVYCTSARRVPDGLAGLVTTMEFASRRLPHRVIGVERAYRYHDRRVAHVLTSDRHGFEVVHCWPRAVLATARVAHEKEIPVLREVPNTHTQYAFEAVKRETQTLGLPLPANHSHAFDFDVLSREESEYAAVDVLLAPSEFSRKTFLERGISETKLMLHDYGFDPATFGPLENVRSSDRAFTVAFVGRCEPRKGLHYALRAWFDSGADVDGRLIVCGDFDPAYLELLRPLLDHSSVSSLGFSRDIAPLLREADVLALPSVEEGSALVTYEAQGCGCVLLVSDASGARLEHGVHGFIHRAGDVATFTRQLKMLHEDPALVARMRAAVLRDSPRLTWREAGKKLHAIYAETTAPYRKRTVSTTASVPRR